MSWKKSGKIKNNFVTLKSKKLNSDFVKVWLPEGKRYLEPFMLVVF